MKTEESLIRINQAAAQLSVTPATIYNWIKTGKITTIERVDGGLALDAKEIQGIYDQISQEHNPFLKTRRNKRFVAGLSIPVDYITYGPYLDLINDIIRIAGEISDFRLLLMEIILKLLNTRNKISIKTNEQPCCFVLAYQYSCLDIEKTLDLILQEVLDLRSVVLTEHELKVLTQIHQREIPWFKDQDLLGFAYMSLSLIRERKRTGSYYTSYRIVNELTNEVIPLLPEQKTALSGLKILDPCCGSGNFLIQLFLKLKDALLKQGLPTKAAEKVLLEEMLYGKDTDRLAVALAKLNLILSSESAPAEIKKLNISCENTLVNAKATQDNSFNLIVGNPPWGSVISPEERALYSKAYVCAKGTYDTFTLFLEKSFKLLKEEGILSFVLPEAFLNISSHQTIRKLILSTSSVKWIRMRGNDFSKVFSPVITLTVQKKHPSPKHDFTIATQSKMVQLNQLNCLKNKCYIIAGPQTNQETELLHHMKSLQGIKFLKNNAKFALGIVTGNNQRYILPHCPANGEIILKGIHVYKYTYYPESNYIVFDPAKFQQVAPLSIYRAAEKLIYRFINRNLVFAYDNNQILTLNSANIVVPNIDNMSIKYILAVLNSRAVQVFYSTSFNSVKVLRQHLESLPIPPATKTEQNLLGNYVDQVMQTQDPHLKEEIYHQIDERVMSLFELSKQHQQLIDKLSQNTKYLYPESLSTKE